MTSSPNFGFVTMLGIIVLIFSNLFLHTPFKHKSDHIFHDPRVVSDTGMTHPTKLSIFDTDLKDVVQTKQLLSIFTSVKKKFAIIKPNSKYVRRKRLLVMLALLLSGDIHANPGPKGTTKTKEITVRDTSIYLCAYCESGVTWRQAGVCCDNCEVWFHKTCLSLSTSSFENIQDSNVSWICNRCNFTNSESSLFQSYNLELHNSLASLNSSIASVDSVFTPENFSKPNNLPD